MRTINVQFTVSDELDRYLASSARIRRVSRSLLLKAVIQVVLRDQLVLGILDDDSAPMNAGVRTRVPAPSMVP